MVRLAHRDDGPLRRVPRQVPKAPVGHLDKLLVLQGPRANHHHARCRVVRRDVVLQLLLGEAPDVFCRAEDGAAEPALREAHLVQIVEDHLKEQKYKKGNCFKVLVDGVYCCILRS